MGTSKKNLGDGAPNFFKTLTFVRLFMELCIYIYIKNKIVWQYSLSRSPIQQESQSCLKIHPIWKLNAFTCFVAFSWGERFLEVGACCVQLVFWKAWFGTLIFYLRSCTLVLAMSDCLFTYLNKIVFFQRCT